MTTGECDIAPGTVRKKKEEEGGENLEKMDSELSTRNLLQDSDLAPQEISNVPLFQDSIESSLSHLRQNSIITPPLLKKSETKVTEGTMTIPKSTPSPFNISFGSSFSSNNCSFINSASKSTTPPQLVPVASTPIRAPPSVETSPSLNAEREIPKSLNFKALLATPEYRKEKCINFFKSLLSLNHKKDPATVSKKIHKVVQDIILGNISLEAFERNICDILNSQDAQKSGQLIQLLENELPEIRLAMARKEVVIPGITAPTLESIAMLREKSKVPGSTVKVQAVTAVKEGSHGAGQMRSIVIQNCTRPLGVSGGTEGRPNSRTGRTVVLKQSISSVKQSTSGTQTGIIHHYPTTQDMRVKTDLNNSGITVQPGRPPSVNRERIPSGNRAIRPKETPNGFHPNGFHQMPSSSNYPRQTPFPMDPMHQYSQVYDPMYQQPRYYPRNNPQFLMGPHSHYSTMMPPPTMDQMIPMPSPHLSYVTSSGNISVPTPPNGMAMIHHATNHRPYGSSHRRSSPQKRRKPSGDQNHGCSLFGDISGIAVTTSSSSRRRSSSGGRASGSVLSKTRPPNFSVPNALASKPFSAHPSLEKTRTIEALNDVMLMGGINVAEEAQMIFAPGPEVECKKLKESEAPEGLSGLEKFFNPSVIRKRMLRVAEKRGIGDISVEVQKLAAIAVDQKLRDWLSKLSVMAEHRLETPSLRWNSQYRKTSDVREHVKFLNEVDKEEHRQGRNKLREQLIKLSAKKVKEMEDGQELKSRAKELQKEQDQELRNSRANEAALQALGGVRRRPWEADQNTGVEYDGLRDVPSDPGAALNKRMRNAETSGTQVDGRIRRVSMRDFHVLLLNEKDPRKTGLMYKCLFKSRIHSELPLFGVSGSAESVSNDDETRKQRSLKSISSELIQTDLGPQKFSTIRNSLFSERRTTARG